MSGHGNELSSNAAANVTQQVNADDIEEDASGVVEPTARCGKCKNECETGSESLGCEICPKWFHRECVGYNKTTYKAIIQLEEVKWFCKDCNEKAKDTFRLCAVKLRMKHMTQSKIPRVCFLFFIYIPAMFFQCLVVDP